MSHPGVAPSVGKELHFFQHGWSDDFDDEAILEYHRYFPRPPGLVTGEWTPRYMLDSWTLPRLQAAAPEARILVLLRDPLARLQSGLRHHLSHSRLLPPRKLFVAIERGRYGSQLANVCKYFSRDQILVQQLERCTVDPRSELARTYEFVGLDPRFVPDDLEQPIHVGRGDPVVLPADLEQVVRELYAAEIDQLSGDWPELDMDLWPAARQLG